MTFIDRSEVEWKPTKILRIGDSQSWEHEFDLPRPLADWDVWDYWERARFHSMRDNLEQGMTLFDVGTEQGWCNLVYATMVGAENMVLIEPTAEFWPNIEATWHRNFTMDPLACYHGLLSDCTTDETAAFHPWPAAAEGAALIDRNKYQYIHEHAEDIREMALDDLVNRSGIVPDAVTIDVEGAELLVLQGAEQTLRAHHPLVWVSVHPDLGKRDYGVTSDRVHEFMTDLGYMGQHLATDHEEHHLFVWRTEVVGDVHENPEMASL